MPPLPGDHEWMELAIDLSRRCPPSGTAFSVGAVVVDGDGRELARGFSRESDPTEHAEEAALRKLPTIGGQTPVVTIYSTLEPCSRRRSRPTTCSELILQAGIRRVVIAWREPALFVPDSRGVEDLRTAGVTVVELRDLADAARRVNAHLSADP